MNDEEEVVEVLDDGQGQSQEESSSQRRPTIDESLKNARQTVENVGKTVEDVGHAEEKIGSWMKGGGNATEAATDAGTAASSAVETGAKAAEGLSDAGKAASKAQQTAGKAQETAGKIQEAAGKAGEGIGKGQQAAGKAGEGVGQGLQSNPYTAGAGKAVEGVSKGIEAGGKTAENIGKAQQATGKAQQASGKAQQGLGQAGEAAADLSKGAATAADAGAKATKAGNQAVKKSNEGSSKLADKLENSGKKHVKLGKDIQGKAKDFDPDKYIDNAFDKLGKGGKALSSAVKGIAKAFDPKTIGAVFLLLIILGTLLVSYILSPMFFMDLIRQSQITDPDNIEKVNNYLSGLGFQNSKEAFYEEVNYLNIHYGKELDVSYIMSALYYSDIFYGDSSVYTNDKANISYNLALEFLKEYYKEATTTTGEDGLVYSANKLYRLRHLARHQFKGKKEETVDLATYISDRDEQIKNELGNMADWLPLLIPYALVHFDPNIGATVDTFLAGREGIEDFRLLVGLVSGSETWKSIGIAVENKNVSQLIQDFQSLYEIVLGSVFNIKSIKIDGNPFNSYTINVTYYADSYNEEAFEDYLVYEYIPNMPEFSLMLLGKDGKKLEGEELTEQSKKIGYEIKMIKEIFDSLYQTEESAREVGKCIGDINLDLVSELATPIDMKVGQSILFENTNNYGFYKGTMHRGVDLEESSTGTKEGDNVYSLYDGKVVGSTKDGTFLDKTVKGGWLVIDYSVQYENSSAGKGVIGSMFKSSISNIRVYYGGLDPDYLALKSGDVVKKGEVIGYVGDASDSETGEKPSLHFGIYDVRSGLFLNPINMFITCNKKGKKGCKGEGTTVELPKSIFDIKQVNYTVTFYNENGFGSLGIDGSSPQKVVHQAWLDDGARFKNGIAVVNVDGVERYLAAVTKKYGTIGDLLYANLEDGTKLPIIVADEKSYCDTNISIAPSAEECRKSSEIQNQLEKYCEESTTEPGCYGHYKGGLSVLEFEFDNTYVGQVSSATVFEQEWKTDQKVVSITYFGSINDEACSKKKSKAPSDSDEDEEDEDDYEEEENVKNENGEYSSCEGLSQNQCNGARTSTHFCTWTGGQYGCQNGEPRQNYSASCSSFTTQNSCNVGRTATYTCQWQMGRCTEKAKIE